jgi:hypothetical protein
VGNYPIPTVQHVSRDLRLHGVHVVHQGRWRHDAAEENGRGQRD